MSTPRNAEYTKLYNKKTFLRLLRPSPLSRAEVARRMGLSRAAASLIAEELLREGFLTEAPVATPVPSGRPPIALSIAKDAAFALGVYLNRDGCTAGVVSLAGETVAKARFRLESEGRTEMLAEKLQSLLDASAVPREKLIGVGVSAPGPLDMEEGKILNPPRFSLWHGTALASPLEDALRLPVYVENNASSLARYHLGKPEAQGSENFLLLLVDSGIGSGVVLGGKLFYGAAAFTGELGHTTVKLDGRLCACGNRGCLEAYAAIPSLLAGTRFSSWEDVVNERLVATDAAALFEAEAEYLSAGIVSLANLLALDTVLLSGDLCYEGEAIASRLSALCNARILRRDRTPIAILPTHMGKDVKSLAAADIVFDRYLRV